MNHDCSLEECLTTGDIPAGGKKENYYFYCIWKNNRLIGFLAYYLEYQKKDMAYISVIYIKEKYRKNGIGKEIIDAIINEFTLLKIKEIRIHCSLRNAEALKFWIKREFNHIINVEYTGNLFPNNFGGIELTRRI
jgi:ribosomal protein S18 acetylase RimI-like enzyme